MQARVVARELVSSVLGPDRSANTPKPLYITRVSSQLLVSVLFIAVPTNTENSKFFLTLVCVLFLASYVVCNCRAAHAQ